MSNPAQDVPGYVILVNDNAGSSTQVAIDRATARLAAHRPAEIRTCHQTGDIAAVARELDGRVLVVCGGDGSLHITLRELYRAVLLDQVLVGLIPLGTGNDFARMMELPEDPCDAADVIAGGVPRALDLIEVDGGEVAVNVAQAGLGAEASATALGLKPVLKKLAYPVGTAVAGVQAGPWDVHIVVDGVPVAGDHSGIPVTLLAVGNGTFVGGGAELVPGSRVDDGLMHLIVARPAARVHRAGLALDVATGDHPDRDDVIRTRGRRVEITGDPMRYSLDGEIGEPTGQRTFSVLPRAWRMVLPSTEPTAKETQQQRS